MRSITLLFALTIGATTVADECDELRRSIAVYKAATVFAGGDRAPREVDYEAINTIRQAVIDAASRALNVTNASLAERHIVNRADELRKSGPPIFLNEPEQEYLSTVLAIACL